MGGLLSSRYGGGLGERGACAELERALRIPWSRGPGRHHRIPFSNGTEGGVKDGEENCQRKSDSKGE